MRKFIHLFFIIFFINLTFVHNFSYAKEIPISQQLLPPATSRIPEGPSGAPITPAHTILNETAQPVPSGIMVEPTPSIVPSRKGIMSVPSAPPQPSQTKQPSEQKKPLQATTSKTIPTYEKISLPDAINYALTHNLDIKGNRLNVDIACNNIKVANRLKNPYILSFFNFGKAATDNPNTMGLIFPIEIFKRGARKNLAKSTFELTKGTVRLAELNLRLDVRQAYVDLVAAKSTLRILNDQRLLLQELLYIAQKKYEAGAVPQMDVIHTKMTLNQLLVQVNTANTNIYTARYKFNMLLDPFDSYLDTMEDYLPEQQDFISILTPSPTEKMPTFDELFNIALQKRIDLQNAQRDIDVAQKNLIVVIRQRIPDIELGGGYMFVSPQLATSGELSQGVFAVGNINNIPLLYQYTPEIKNAKIQVEQKILAYKSLRHQAELDLHSAYDSFLTAQDNLNYYNDLLLRESRQFVTMARRSYEVGKSNITDFIFIQQSYRSIMMSYTSALANYYNAWVEILRQVNDEDIKLNG